MFAWAPIPEPFKALGSVEFSKLLVEKADIAVSPGIGFGEYGEGFVRIALGGKRAAYPSGCAQCPPFPRTRAGATAQRRSARYASLIHGQARLMAAARAHDPEEWEPVSDKVMRNSTSESWRRRIGHGRCRPGCPDRAPARRVGRALRPRHRSCRGLCALACERSRHRSQEDEMVCRSARRSRASPASMSLLS